MKHTVSFTKTIKLKAETSLLNALDEAGIKIKDDCHGKGKCGKCIVFAPNCTLSEPTSREIKRLGENKINKGYRLACQALIQGDLNLNLTPGLTADKENQMDTPPESETLDSEAKEFLS